MFLKTNTTAINKNIFFMEHPTGYAISSVGGPKKNSSDENSLSPPDQTKPNQICVSFVSPCLFLHPSNDGAVAEIKGCSYRGKRGNDRCGRSQQCFSFPFSQMFRQGKYIDIKA